METRGDGSSKVVGSGSGAARSGSVVVALAWDVRGDGSSWRGVFPRFPFDWGKVLLSCTLRQRAECPLQLLTKRVHGPGYSGPASARCQL